MQVDLRFTTIEFGSLVPGDIIVWCGWRDKEFSVALVVGIVGRQKHTCDMTFLHDDGITSMTKATRSFAYLVSHDGSTSRRQESPPVASSGVREAG